MIKKYCLLITCLIFSVAAYSADPQSQGFYIGGAGGSSEFDDDGAFQGFDVDDSDTSLTIMGGYKVNRFFSVEARYSDLGTFKVSHWYYDISEKADVEALSIHAVGIIPFGASGWAIFGQLGLARVGFDCDDCSDETAGSAGIGVQYSFTESLALAAQIDAYAWEADDDYTLSVVTAQIASRYIF